jgi:hypothetical protein
MFCERVDVKANATGVTVPAGDSLGDTAATAEASRAPVTASRSAVAAGWAAYGALVALLFWLSHRGVAVPGGRKTLFAFSAVGVWRLGWLIVNIVRALLYQRRRFPHLRKQADALGELGRPTELYVLVTSYKM